MMWDAWMDRLALEALRRELHMPDKPGLVSPGSAGAHRDMDATRMCAGIDALAGYFGDAFLLGWTIDAWSSTARVMQTFEELRKRGRAAERAMYAATGGVNTHLGAIFQMGILAYLSGRIVASGEAPDRKALSRMAIADPAVASLALEGDFGARAEASSGFSLTMQALDVPEAQRLYWIMARLRDTNILRRGGESALEEVRALARRAAEGEHWAAEDLRALCLARGVSPGGAADVLASGFFIESMERGWPAYLERLRSEMLDAREAVVGEVPEEGAILSLVFPGPVKVHPALASRFAALCRLAEADFPKGAVHEGTWETAAGYFARYRWPEQPAEEMLARKRRLVELETREGIVDVDLYVQGRPFGRAEAGVSPRRCLVCGQPAKICRAADRHETPEVLRAARRRIFEGGDHD